MPQTIFVFDSSLARYSYYPLVKRETVHSLHCGKLEKHVATKGSDLCDL